jgi:hypothetical protein
MQRCVKYLGLQPVDAVERQALERRELLLHAGQEVVLFFDCLFGLIWGWLFIYTHRGHSPLLND